MSRLVILRRFNPYHCKGMQLNRAYALVKSYWRNGEGWYRVRDEETRETFDVPDILFSDCWVNIPPNN